MDLRESEISAEEVRQYQQEGREFTLLDVRKPSEREAASLGDDLWIQMQDVPEEVDQLEECNRPLVVYCHHGMRSLKITQYLRDKGIDEVFSLAGGIDYWSRNIDEEVPRY